MGRSPPIRSKRGHLKVASHTPLSDVGHQARRAERSERGYSEASSPICRVGQLSFWHCAPFSATRAHERCRFHSVKAWETFCVLVAYTEAQKSLKGIQGT